MNFSSKGICVWQYSEQISNDKISGTSLQHHAFYSMFLFPSSYMVKTSKTAITGETECRAIVWICKDDELQDGEENANMRPLHLWDSTQSGTGKGRRERGREGGTCVVCLWQQKWLSTVPIILFPSIISSKGNAIENQGEIQGLRTFQWGRSKRPLSFALN